MMRSNIPVANRVNEVKYGANRAVNSRWMAVLARIGYIVKGVLYIVIGALAVQLATGHGGKATDQRGALEWINTLPFGKFLLVLMIIGLIGFGLWSLIQAIFDTEGEGKRMKGILARIGYAVIGIVYIGLAIPTIRLVAGSGGGQQSTTTSTQDWTATFLKQPFGPALVIIGGLIIIGVAIYLMKKAYSADFKRHLSLSGIGARLRSWVIGLGRFGYAAIGVVFAIIGIFLIVAALQHNPGQAKGLDAALLTLVHEPFGPVLLAIVALGFIAYGFYSFAEARYRRIGK
jgi:hypothetical protein